MAALIAAHDWSATLGSVAAWPQSLKTTVGLMIHSPVPIVLLWGEDGIMLYNDAYSIFAGSRHPQLLGSKVREGWPEVADFNDNVMKVGLAGGTLSYREQELTLNRRGKPEAAWMNLDYSPVIDESGKPGGVIAVVMEITDQILAERLAAAERDRLAQSEARLQMALSAGNGVGTYDWDIQADSVVADARFARLYGVDPAKAAAGAPIAEFFANMHPGDQEHTRRLIAETMETGKDFSAAYRLIQADGSIRWVRADGQCIRATDGTPLRFSGVTFDITANRRDQARLAALAQLGDAIRDVDDPDELAYGAAEILGRALDVSRAGYGTVDPATETITIVRDWNAPGVASLAGTLNFRDYGSYIEDLKRGDTVVIADARTDPRAQGTAAALEAISARSLVNMPVSEQGGLVALLYLNNAMAREWSGEEIAFIREVAERTRTAVERRRGEAEMRSIAERFNLATAAANIGTFDFNLLNGELSWDVRCKALFGLSPDANVTYEIFLKGLHPDDRAATNAAVQSALDPAGLGRYDVEYRVIGLEDGIERWIAAAGEVVFDKGVAVRFVGTVLDISAAKRAEASLRESEAQFRTMAQAMPNHVWTATPDGQLDWLNDQTAIYSGAEPENLLGNAWTAIVHPGDLDDAGGKWGAALSSGEPYQVEFRLRRFDGQWRWHLARAEPIRNAAGDVIRWVGTNTDIQDQKEIAAALENINQTLEARVAERTARLQETEEALRQSQKMEAVGQLTGGIAHDFNNLLQGITGALDRVQHRITEKRYGDVERFLKAAMESANRAASLTHRLLAFSRRQTLDPRALDTNRLIAGMEDLIRRTMGPNVAVEVVGAGGLWPIKADASQLENALLNLCINARDAMPGGGKLTIETANKWLDERAAKDRELPPGQYVSLCVTDSGTGMPPEVIARAFDPFFTTKPLGQGTGLGLSMTYGFVRQSGGQVRIYSEEGKGTTMCLYFPRHLGTVEDEAAQAGELVERGFGETVLVVDDEPTVRMLIAEVLTESYYNIVEAGDGPAALKILESRQRIDMMITDVGLPGGMNGRQVADAARVQRPGLKVLFITGYAENAAVGNGHLDPGMEILAKPFAMSTLANKVREMIER